MRSIACIIVVHGNCIQGFPIADCTSYKLFAEKNKYILEREREFLFAHKR